MTRATCGIRRIMWALCVCAVLAPHVAHAAERSIVADFDGDGQHDRATLDSREPSILRVSLSTTRSTAILRSRVPIVRIVARDLDGDRRAELIAGASSGLHVWTQGRKGFRTYHPRPVTPGTVGKPLRHHIDDGAGNSPVAITSHATSLLTLLPSGHPRAATPGAACLVVPFAGDLYSPLRFAPLAARPPPASR